MLLPIYLYSYLRQRFSGDVIFMIQEQKDPELMGFLAIVVLSISWLTFDSQDYLPLKYLISMLIIINFAMMFHQDSRFCVPSLFFLGLCLRFHYQSFVGFTTVPYGDAQIDLFMSNVLLENGQITFIEHELYDDRLLYYSSWPLSQICVVILSSVTGFSTMYSTHIVQLQFYLASFFLILGITHWFNSEVLDSSRSNIKWAILLFVTLPEINYWQGEVVRMNLGVLSSFFVVYSLILVSNADSRFQGSFALILSCMMLAFSHNLTTAISVLVILLSISIIFFLSNREGSVKDAQTKSFLNMSFNLLSLLSVMAIIWWSLVGEVLFPKIQGVVSRYSKLLSEGFSLTHDPRVQIAPELSPLWSEVFLYGRDFIIFGATAIGFLHLAKLKLGKSNFSFNLLFSFSASYFIIFLMLFLWAEPFRVLTFASPFMAICFAHSISSKDLLGQLRSNENLPIFFLVFILCGSFISPNTHTHAPLYFYDDDFSEIEYGLPGANAPESINFLMENSNPNTSILSDYPDFAIHPVGPSDVSRFTSIGLSLKESQQDLEFVPQGELVILFRDGSLYQHQSAQSTDSSFIDFTSKAKSAIKSYLINDANKVYDQGDGVSIWTIPS